MVLVCCFIYSGFTKTSLQMLPPTGAGNITTIVTTLVLFLSVLYLVLLHVCVIREIFYRLPCVWVW
jgi:hypothetical protein